MSRRKLKMLFWMVAVALAFVPFLQSCATDTNNGTTQEEVVEEIVVPDAGEASDLEAVDVEYGQVVTLDGDQLTVLLGEYAALVENADEEVFAAGEDQMTFSLDGLSVYDENGAEVDASTLVAGDVVAIASEPDATVFTPASVTVVDKASDAA